MKETEATKDPMYQMPPLSDEFVYQIVFCMEDQSQLYLLDLQSGLPVQKNLLRGSDVHDRERFIDIPLWRPSDGFRVMEKFVASLRNPIYRQKLHDALARGKGVFREFKNVLKEEPAVERLWFYFKEREIKQQIYSWYEQQTEVLYLKSLGEPEENVTDLILSDFIISYDMKKWEDHIKEIGTNRLRIEFSSLGYPVSDLLAGEYEESWEQFDQQWLMVFVESPSEEFAGFIGAKPMSIDEHSLIYMVRHLYVEPRFRGLGIFKLLADTLCKRAEQEGADRIIMELSGKAAVLSPALERRGFELIAKRFALDLSSWRDIQTQKG